MKEIDQVITLTENYLFDSFDNTLLMEVIKLLSIATMVDSHFSKDERKYIRKYFDSFYPTQSKYLFNKFSEFCDYKLQIDSVVNRINSGFSYENRIFILMKIYELLKADRLERTELNFLEKLAEFLKIKEEDFQFIQSIYDPRRLRVEEIIDTVFISLRISDDPSHTDIFLPAQDLLVEIYRIGTYYCIIQKDEHNKISVNDTPLPKNFVIKIQHNQDIQINTYRIYFEDLKLYFQIKKHPLKEKKIYLDVENNQHWFRSTQNSNSILEFMFNKSLIIINPLINNINLIINDIEIINKIYVNLNDNIYIKNNLINIRKIFFEQIIEKYEIELNKSLYVISNDIKGDLVIFDEFSTFWQSEILKINNKYFINTGNCPHDIFVNSKKIINNYKIKQNDTIFIYKNIIKFNFKCNLIENITFNLKSFIGKKIKYLFNDKSVGLDDISFEIEHGDFVAIMGPSGCGKSTLVNIMNGNYFPESGEILINSTKLESNLSFFKTNFGYVPQDDLLFENLTAYENLYYNAKLRFPHKIKKDIDALVNKVLLDIGLIEKKNIKVGSPLDKTLSGGERKRLNIGLELLGEAEIYFLDEPTSGLSSKDSEKVMELLKKFALRGNIVFVVIHQPSSKLYKIFNKLILLDKGGKLAFFGNNYSALHYFKSHAESDSQVVIECPACKRTEPDLILDILEEPILDIDGIPLPERKYPPEYWKQRFQNYRHQQSTISVEIETQNTIPPQRSLSLNNRLNQFGSLVSRNFKNKLRNKSNLLITFIEAPLLGFLIGFILRYAPAEEYTFYDNTLYKFFIFLSIIVAIFLAMTNSVDEIIKDAAILLRERMLNIKNRSYLGAKILTLLTFAAFQNILFLLAGFWILNVKALFIPYWIFLTLVSMSGISMGLFVSSLPRLSSKAALNIIPLILIPQIILGGALISYEKMNRELRFNENNPIPEICHLMPSRWAYEGLIVMQGTFIDVQTKIDSLQRDLKEFRLSRESYIKERGTEEYKIQIKKMEQEIEDFRINIRNKYQNLEVLKAVENGNINNSKKNIDSRRISKSFFSSPMFVSNKEIPILKMKCNTVYYNSFLILSIIILTVLLSLFMLRFGDNIVKKSIFLSNTIKKYIKNFK